MNVFVDFHYDTCLLSDYRRMFNQFDKDGSGSLSLPEVGRMLAKLGKDITQEELKELFSTIDTNGATVIFCFC